MSSIPVSDPFPSIHQHIRIVLAEPAGGLNVGAIARVMKNMGMAQLTLVSPHCDPLGADARQMAVTIHERGEVHAGCTATGMSNDVSYSHTGDV